MGLLLALTGVPGSAEEPSGPRDPETLGSEAHGRLVMADRARDEENRAEALFQYHAARKLYQALHEAYPDWETDFIEFRIEYSENQLRAIREEAGLNAWDGWAQQRREWQQERAGFEARRNALVEENRYLRQRVDTLERTLTEVADEIEEVETLHEELRRLEQENRDLRRRLERRPRLDAPVPRGR